MVMARRRTHGPLVPVESEREVPVLMTAGEVARVCRIIFDADAVASNR